MACATVRDGIGCQVHSMYHHLVQCPYKVASLLTLHCSELSSIGLSGKVEPVPWHTPKTDHTRRYSSHSKQSARSSAISSKIDSISESAWFWPLAIGSLTSDPVGITQSNSWSRRSAAIPSGKSAPSSTSC